MKTDLKIQPRTVESLIPYARNARTHTEEQVAQIAASIKEFGWTNPILVDGDNGIIAGHGRLLAARKLGMTHVPVIELKSMTDSQRRAYILADNKLALNSGWDEELLKLELHALDEMKFDLEMTGFNGEELSAIMFPEPPEEKDGSDKGVNFVVQYNIVFDDEEQQEVFFGFIRRLKAEDPDSTTLGQRLTKFIQENGFGEG